jgi:DNA polymerase delta subunit 2
MARSVSYPPFFITHTSQNWIAPPAPRAKFYSAQDAVHIEDESGRVRLIGEKIRRERDREGGGLVTGVIMAVLGFETGNGDFEVVDLCFAGLPDVYRPTPGPSGIGSGKGKAKASEDAMDVDDGECGTMRPANSSS